MSSAFLLRTSRKLKVFDSNQYGYRLRSNKKSNEDNDKIINFKDSERFYLSLFNINKLSDKDLEIHLSHSKAVKDMELFYTDPESGLMVMTRWYHFRKGVCCGNACRHCVYGHEKVPEKLRIKRRFNSSFWINN